MPRDLVIGLDSSTTACKAVVWDMHGNALAAGRAPLPMFRPRPAWHEQPANAWWETAVLALREATAQVDTSRLAALSIAPQRETFVVAGQDGEPLTEAFLWMDERCRDLLPEIDRLYGKDRIHAESGKPLSANLSLGKLFWLRQHRPDLFAKIGQVLDVHAFLASRLTGRSATAWGCADPTGLFDMRLNAWNPPLIAALGLRLDQFPEALPGGSMIGGLTPSAARQCGLPEGLPLIAGLGDGQAAGLGVNAVHPGDAYLNLGTAVVSGTFSRAYWADLAFRTMYAGLPGAYALETVLLGGTYTLNWFVDQFERPAAVEWDAAGFDYNRLEADAARIPPGAQGLVLVPYWNSAMNPYWDASASGMIVGWRGIHGKAHLYRAILEGIALEQRLHTSGVEAALGSSVERYIAVGGGSRSPLWLQIIADVAGKPVYQADTPEASALGVGILAAAGAGLYPGIEQAAQAMTRIHPRPTQPDPQRCDFYTRLYETVYRRLYPALQSTLASLADLVAEGQARAG